MERQISVWPIKEDHLQRWSRIFRNGSEPKRTFLFDFRPKFPGFGHNWKRLLLYHTTIFSTHNWSRHSSHLVITASCLQQMSIITFISDPLIYIDKEEYIYIFLPSCKLEGQVIIIVVLPRKLRIYCTWNRKESKCTSGMKQKKKKSNGQSLLHETRGVKWKLERVSEKYTREEVAAAISSLVTPDVPRVRHAIFPRDEHRECPRKRLQYEVKCEKIHHTGYWSVRNKSHVIAACN